MASIRKIAALLLFLLPGITQGDVTLKGKMTSKIIGHVSQKNNLFITDEKGGWYDQGLAMEQPGAFDSPYVIKIPVRVTSSSGLFQTTLAAPLVLQHQDKPLLSFRNVKVTMNQIDNPEKEITATVPVFFSNPAAIDDEDSIGHYFIFISGYPPAGDFKSVAGTYSGVLSLLFEPVVK